MASVAETVKLIIGLELKDGLSRGLKAGEKNLAHFEKSVGRIGGLAQQGLGNASRNLAKIGAVAAVGIGAAVKSGIDSLATLESAVASVDGAIEQMNLTVTGSQVARWANEIEAATGAAFDDKDIVAATENLIRYGKVTESNLLPAMEVMTDLAAKTGDVASASSLLGKALADPAKAAGKLSRYGIILTKAQQDQLKAMMEVNDVAGAQALLLDELAKTTKGAAAASQGPYKRAMSILADVTEDAQRALAEGFLPVLMKASDLLQKALADPKVVNNIREFGKTLASGLDSLIEIASNLPWAQIGQSLQLAGAGAKAVLGAFTALPPWVQTAVLTGWGLNRLTGGALGSIVGELSKGLIKGVLGMTAGVVNINAAKVFGGGGLPGGGKGPGGLPAAAPAAGLGIGAAGLTTLAAGIGAVLFMNLLPYVFKGREGSSGPTLETNKNPAFATTAVLNTLAQQMTETARGTAAVRDKVSTVSADIRNGFSVQATAIKNGFTTTTAGASKTTEAIRNGFNTQATAAGQTAEAIRNGFAVNQSAVKDVARVTAAGDERTTSRIAAMNSAVTSKLGGVTGAVNRTTSTLAAKNMSPKVAVTTNVSTVVSVRAVTNGQTTVSSYNNRGTTATWGGGR